MKYHGQADKSQPKNTS